MKVGMLWTENFMASARFLSTSTSRMSKPSPCSWATTGFIARHAPHQLASKTSTSPRARFGSTDLGFDRQAAIRATATHSTNTREINVCICKHTPWREHVKKRRIYAGKSPSLVAVPLEIIAPAAADFAAQLGL